MADPYINEAIEPQDPRLYDYNICKPRLRRLIDNFSPILTRCNINRKQRKLDIDPEQLRRDKTIRADETFIPIRTIDSNIDREQPKFIQFLTQPTRLLAFKCITDPEYNTQQLEEEVTKGLTYISWELPFFETLDGAQCHGWDSLEVVFDETKPLHVGFEHIGNENLIFPQAARNLQECSEIVRKFCVTMYTLEQWVIKYGFDAQQVQMITDSRRDNDKEFEDIIIYRRYCKHSNGVVYVSWFSLDGNATDWLKPPEMLFVGISQQQLMDPSMMMQDPNVPPELASVIQQPTMQWVPSPVTIYPIFIHRYSKTEEDKIVSLRGRAFKDMPKQEGLTCLWTSFVNGANRSANVYGSPKASDYAGASPKQLEVVIEHGKFYNQPVEFWSTNPPDVSLLAGAQALDVQNSQEAGQVNFAVQNKKGSRTTATEIEQADQVDQELTSISIMLYSTFVREVFSFSWMIIQSQALQQQVPLLQIQQATMLGETFTTNDMEKVGYEYSVRAAGDDDVVKKREELKIMLAMWPLIQATPIAPMFLADMLRLAFPKQGPKYAQALMQAADDTALIASLAEILKVALSPDEIAGLTPEQQKTLAVLAVRVQQRLGGQSEPGRDNQTALSGGAGTAQIGSAPSGSSGNNANAA